MKSNLDKREFLKGLGFGFAAVTFSYLVPKALAQELPPAAIAVEDVLAECPADEPPSLSSSNGQPIELRLPTYDRVTLLHPNGTRERLNITPEIALSAGLVFNKESSLWMPGQALQEKLGAELKAAEEAVGHCFEATE